MIVFIYYYIYIYKFYHQVSIPISLLDQK